MSRTALPVVCDGTTVYPGVAEASAATGVSPSCIYRVLRGESGEAGGHTWRLARTPGEPDPVARFRCCRYCRRWTPGPPGQPGRCADGYSAAPTDTCARLDMVYKFAVD